MTEEFVNGEKIAEMISGKVARRKVEGHVIRYKPQYGTIEVYDPSGRPLDELDVDDYYDNRGVKLTELADAINETIEPEETDD